VGEYDAIVIGTGLGGLTAAALLARAGWSVLALEAGRAAGGYAHAFSRNGYTFDPAIHMVPEAPYFKNLLGHLGVADDVDLALTDSLYSAHFPGARIDVGHRAHDSETFLEPHIRAFPGQEQKLRDLFALFEVVFQEAAALPFRVLGTELADAETRFPNLIRYRTASVQEVLDEYLDDDRLTAALTAPWSYLGMPPAKLSFLLYAQMINVMVRGAYHAVGGFQTVVDALVKGFTAHGGELLTETPVTKIVIEDNQVRGVETAEQRYDAPVVISGADGTRTLTELVGVEHLSRAITRRLDRLKPSISSFLLYAGTGMDLKAAGAGHENLLFNHWSHDDTWTDIQQARPGGMSIVVPSLHDPSLAPPGQHAVVVRALAPYDAHAPWPELKESYKAAVLAECDAIFPGFSDALDFAEAATPLTLERFAGNHKGAAFGWENSPAQAGNRRLPHELGIGGLFLTGHWTQEGTGSLRVLFSAATVAGEALEARGAYAGIPDFRRPRGAAMQEDEDRKRLVRRFFDEVWNQGRLEFIDEFYDPNFKLHALWENTALGGSGDATIEEAKAAIRGWRAGFSDLNVTIEEQVVEGEVVTTRHNATGINDRSFRGIPATGKSGSMSGITMTRIVDGKITEAWTLWDVVGLMRQLGVVPDAGKLERNKAIVRRFYEELWNEGRMETADELFDENFIGHAPGNAEDSRGPEGVKKLINMWRTAAPDLKVEIISQQAEGDKVATRFTCAGTQTGPLMGIDPTGNYGVMAGIAITRIVDGKVMSDWGEFDLLGLMQQLGVVPGGD